ncbi:MAG TPA: hypothetical protein VGE22_17405 [Solimonas sp.]
MNKPYIQRGANGGAKFPYQPKAQPNLHAPTFSKPAVQPDPKETAQETVPQVMPKAAAEGLLGAAPATSIPDPALRAPGGDDDLMSKPLSKPAKTS